MPVSKRLAEEFQYYQDHHSELVKEYDGKVIVIKNQKVVGSYPSEIEAIAATLKTEKPGTFLVQRCSPEIETQSFTSRVVV